MAAGGRAANEGGIGSERMGASGERRGSRQRASSERRGSRQRASSEPARTRNEDLYRKILIVKDSLLKRIDQ